MFDPRLERLADVLVNYSVAVRKGDVVTIQGNTASDPLVLCIYRAVLQAGGHPWVRLAPEDCEELFLKHASDAQLRYTSELDKVIMSRVDARIGLWADVNTRALTDADPARQAAQSRARKPIMDIFFKRAAKPHNDPTRLRWVGTAYPTPGMAQDAEMSLSDYANFVFNAGKLSERDPVAAWKKLGVAQQRLID